MHHVVQVPPLSRRKIRERAAEVRSALKMNSPYFPVMDVVEFSLQKAIDDFVLEIWTLDDMTKAFGTGTHAMTYPNEMRMILREDVYRGAKKDKGRDRFTVAHEFAHLVLHQSTGMARRLPTEILAFENSEWQADTFAGEILMPLPFVLECETVQEIVDVFKVSYEAARVRRTVLIQEGLI
jgi:Zn-dependent peptidase ImmA (M78 family)